MSGKVEIELMFRCFVVMVLVLLVRSHEMRIYGIIRNVAYLSKRKTRM